MFLSVIIPAYNEENRIAATLSDVAAYLRKQSYEYEILVVDDGSIDKTVDVISNFKSQIPNFHILKNSQNIGKGFVVRQGMLAATGQYRIFMDADSSTNITEVETFLAHTKEGFDVVIGSRSLRTSTIVKAQPFVRRVLGKIFRWLAAVASGAFGIHDSQCGFKLFSAKAAQSIFSQATIDGFAFDVEALALAKKQGYGIKEVPVSWKNDTESKVGFVKMVKMLQELTLIFFRF